MRTLIGFSILQEYNQKVLPRGDKLLSIAGLVNWKRFLPIGDGRYKNNTERGGRPNIDIIIMIKLLVLQEMFGLSDPQLEIQVADRISFRVFLGTTETIPDYTTVWTFRKRLKESDKYNDIWDEFTNQLRAKGYEVQKGVIQDATFITSDPGHAMPAIEHCSLVLHEDFLAGCTFQTLSVFSGSPILDNISVANQTVIGTIFVSTKRTS